MNANTALITGIEGFTGAYVAAELSSLGYAVHGLARSGLEAPARTIADLCDLAQVSAAIDAIRPNVVVHLAGISHVEHNDVQELYRSNIVATRNLLKALSENPQVPSIVLLPSSAHVYGPASEGVLTEDSPFAPHNDYAVSKVAMEYMARLWMDKLPIVVTRPFNYTGVGQAPSFLVPKIVGHARRAEARITLGNLDVARDFMDVRDLAGCYGRIVAARPIGKTINVCSGTTTSLQQIIQMVSELSGVAFDIETDERFVRSNEVKCLSGANDYLQDLIGGYAFRSLRDTLEWMLTAP